MKQRLKMLIAQTVRPLAKPVLFCLGAMMLSVSPLHAENTSAPQTLTELAKRIQSSDFVLEDIDGKKRRLSDLRGKVVLVNFWATWCPPCRREMPSIERVSRILKGPDFEVLAVNVGENLDTVFSFTGTLDPVPTFPIVFDRDSSVLKAWPVRGLPATFILDKQGRIVYRAVGGREFDDPAILAQLQSLLDERPGKAPKPVK